VFADLQQMALDGVSVAVTVQPLGQVAPPQPVELLLAFDQPWQQWLLPQGSEAGMHIAIANRGHRHHVAAWSGLFRKATASGIAHARKGLLISNSLGNLLVHAVA
jgi:hypothetical protein